MEAHRCYYIHLGEERDPNTPTTKANDTFRDIAHHQVFDSTAGHPPPPNMVANHDECLRQVNCPFNSTASCEALRRSVTKVVQLAKLE